MRTDDVSLVVELEGLMSAREDMVENLLQFEVVNIKRKDDA